MEYHEREFFISRIIAGYTRININGLILKIHPPSDSILYDAQDFFQAVYDECKREDVYTEKEMLDFLYSEKLWSDDQEERLKRLTDSLDDLRVRIYNAVFRDNDRQHFRTNLRRAEGEIQELILTKKMFDMYTCEGIAGYAKMQYIIERCTRYNGKQYNWDDTSIPTVFAHLQSKIISDKVLRELSHNEPWNTHWSVSKKIGKIFKNRYLSDDQKRLISWSSMYENIYKSPDCPHDSIIDDDDMLDGWLVLQRREREKKQNQKRGEDVLGKAAKADEVFIVADTPEAIRRVYDMNSPSARSVINSRKKKLKEKGVVDIREFDDIKLKILNQINEGQK